MIGTTRQDYQTPIGPPNPAYVFVSASLCSELDQWGPLNKNGNYCVICYCRSRCRYDKLPINSESTNLLFTDYTSTTRTETPAVTKEECVDEHTPVKLRMNTQGSAQEIVPDDASRRRFRSATRPLLLYAIVALGPSRYRTAPCGSSLRNARTPTNSLIVAI